MSIGALISLLKIQLVVSAYFCERFVKLRFSIITPCFNAANFIEEAIESVLSQRGNFEIQYIVVDGGSSDATVRKLKYYQRQLKYGLFPVRCLKVDFSYISEPDKGMYDALVKGLKRADGDIVAYINADDYYLPNAFSAVATAMDCYDEVEWITGVNTWFNRFGHIVHTNLPPGYRADFIQKGLYGQGLPHIQQESTFWRNRLLKNIDYERLASLRLAGDYYLWHQFSQSADLKVIKAQLAGFRVHEDQLSANIDAYQEEFSNIISARPTIKDHITKKLYAKLWQLPHKIKPQLLKDNMIGLHSPKLASFRLNHLDTVNQKGLLDDGAANLPMDYQRRYIYQQRWLKQKLFSKAIKGRLRQQGDSLEGAPYQEADGNVSQAVINNLGDIAGLGDKTCYRLPPSKAVKNQFHGFQEVVCSGDTVVLVYQMGKVSSTSLMEALKGAKLEIPKYQIHFLNPAHLEDTARWYEDRGIEFSPGHITVSNSLAPFIKHHKSDIKWKIISLMRDPIAFQISSVFENIHGHQNDLKMNSDGFDSEAYRQKVIDRFTDKDDQSYYFMDWFRSELETTFGVDIFAHSSNFGSGFSIVEQDNVEVLLLKFEDLEWSVNSAIDQFLGLEGIRMNRINVGQDKDLGQQYSEFVQSVKFPSRLCDDIYSTEVVKYFYSEEEISAFKQRWSMTKG